MTLDIVRGIGMYIIVYWNVHHLEGLSVAYFDIEEQRPEADARL